MNIENRKPKEKPNTIKNYFSVNLIVKPFEIDDKDSVEEEKEEKKQHEKGEKKRKLNESVEKSKKKSKPFEIENKSIENYRSDYPVHIKGDIPRRIVIKLNKDDEFDQVAIYKRIVDTLSTIHEKDNIELVINNEIVVNSLSKWFVSWQQNNWKTKNGNDVKNKELIQSILKLVSKRKGVTFFKFK